MIRRGGLWLVVVVAIAACALPFGLLQYREEMGPRIVCPADHPPQWDCRAINPEGLVFWLGYVGRPPHVYVAGLYSRPGIAEWVGEIASLYWPAALVCLDIFLIIRMVVRAFVRSGV